MRSASSSVVPTDTVTRFSFVITLLTAWSRFFSNRRSRLVRMPTSRAPRVTGSPETRYFVMMSIASRTDSSGEIVTGSTIIPLSERFTRSTSSAWRSTPMLRCTNPSPPWRAMAIARRDSVTVSIAAETSGMFSEILRVSCVLVSTSVGRTEDFPGTSSTSSNVKPSVIGPSIHLSLTDRILAGSNGSPKTTQPSGRPLGGRCGSMRENLGFMDEFSFYAARWVKASAPRPGSRRAFCRKMRVRMVPFEPHPLLRNPHAQTLVCAFLPRSFPRLPRSTPREFETEPGTRIRGECHWQAVPRERPTVVLVHGLEGSSESGYMLGLAERAFAAGWNAVRLNQRNCGGTESLTPTLYNSGLSGDYRAVLNELIERDLLPEIFFAGYSMGGNLVLKMVGEF